jgi:hypothetical protein
VRFLRIIRDDPRGHVTATGKQSMASLRPPGMIVSRVWGASLRWPFRAVSAVHAGCERPLEQRRTSGGKELRPVAPLALGVRAFSALPRHFLRSWTTDEASSGTEDSSSQKVSPGWGSSYRHPPRAEMPSGPVLLPSTPPFPPLVLRCSSGRTAGGSDQALADVGLARIT